MTDSVENSSPPSDERPRYQPGEPVALFIPCYMDQFYPEVGRATVRLLARLGVPVVFPRCQTCCGQPAFNSGYWEPARRVIRQFARTFADYRFIVCPSGSCAAMCRVFFAQAESDPQVRRVGSRVFELTEFLVDLMGVTDTGAHFPHKVTFHSSCHGRRELGILRQPLTLLQNVRGLQYVELPNMEECCGFGGTFSVKMPGVSLAMGRTKAENILNSGAEVVCSVDISCLMHVGGIIRRDPGMQHIRLMHIAEVLAAENGDPSAASPH